MWEFCTVSCVPTPCNQEKNPAKTAVEGSHKIISVLHLGPGDESPKSHRARIPEVCGAIRGVCCSRWGHDEQPDKHRAVEKLEPE